MAVELGGGNYAYAARDEWARLPDEIVLGDVAAVGVDRQGRVYAFNRGEHLVAVGTFIFHLVDRGLPLLCCYFQLNKNDLLYTFPKSLLAYDRVA